MNIFTTGYRRVYCLRSLQWKTLISCTDNSKFQKGYPVPESGLPGQYRYRLGAQKTSDPLHRKEPLVSFGFWLAVSRLDPPLQHAQLCMYPQSSQLVIFLCFCKWYTIFFLFNHSWFLFAVFLMAASKRQSLCLVIGVVQPVFCLPVRQGTPKHLQRCTHVVYWVKKYTECFRMGVIYASW